MLNKQPIDTIYLAKNLKLSSNFSSIADFPDFLVVAKIYSIKINMFTLLICSWIRYSISLIKGESKNTTF